MNKETNLMKNFIEYVAKSLMGNHQHVIITEQHDENKYKLELHAPHTEVGKVIGKHGMMADALRTVASFHAAKVLKKSLTFRIIDDTSTH